MLFNGVNLFSCLLAIVEKSRDGLFLHFYSYIFCLSKQSLPSSIFSIAPVEHVVCSEYFDATLVISRINYVSRLYERLPLKTGRNLSWSRTSLGLAIIKIFPQ